MKKNILIIDDSALMRRVISDIINSDNRFQVTEYATNGLEGLAILQKRANDFDVVLLDINMPKMNGIELLQKMKEQNLRATVIIVSTIAKNDAKETILALELGAFDFVTKPESFLEVKSNIFSGKILQCVSDAMKLEQKMPDVMVNKTFPINQLPSRKVSKKHIQGSKLVALACSTGGPKALHEVIPKLPGNLDCGVLVVQHMPEGFTKSLAARLNELSLVHVKEAQDGEVLKKGTVYIAKGGHQMRLKHQSDGSYLITVTKEPARHGLAPCADIMYESLVNADFDQITCVVLTGMGGDGTAGIKQLNVKNNIYVIAQNEETSIVYGMPKVIRDAGLVDEVVALQEVANAITKNVGVN